MRMHAMKTGAIAIGLTAILSMGGCKNQSYDTANNNATPSASQPAATSASASTSPEDLGKIGADIKKHPKEANKILSEHGLTEASFEKAIRSVSSSPDESRRYRDAYKKAGA